MAVSPAMTSTPSPVKQSSPEKLLLSPCKSALRYEPRPLSPTKMSPTKVTFAPPNDWAPEDYENLSLRELLLVRKIQAVRIGPRKRTAESGRSAPRCRSAGPSRYCDLETP